MDPEAMRCVGHAGDLLMPVHITDALVHREHIQLRHAASIHPLHWRIYCTPLDQKICFDMLNTKASQWMSRHQSLAVGLHTTTPCCGVHYANAKRVHDDPVAANRAQKLLHL